MDNIADLSGSQQNPMSVVKNVEISACPSDSKVDPRRRRTRKMLEEAIRSLLAERSLADISVVEIAERAELNRATFYAHFDSKEQLASTVLSEGLEQAILRSLATTTRFDAERLAAVTTATFEFVDHLSNGCAKHGTGSSDSVGSILQETLYRFFSSWFKRDSEALGWFPKVPADVVVTILSWSIYGGAIRWRRLPNRPTAAQAAKQIVDLLVVAENRGL